MQNDFSKPASSTPAPSQQPYAAPAAQSANQAATSSQPAGGENKNKLYLMALVFSAFGGYFGLDRFYLGYKKLGIIKFITFGGLGIWALVDFILAALGSLRQQGDARPLDGYGRFVEDGKLALKVTIAGVVYFFILYFAVLASLLAIAGVQGAMQSQDQAQPNSSEQLLEENYDFDEDNL